MKAIEWVGILGAGAMGAYFASRFFDSPGFSTALIARGERGDRLRDEGLVINGRRYDIPVVDPADTAEPMDLIIAALKHHHMAEAFQGIEGLVGDATIFVSVMNGLESEEYIGSLFGMDKVLYAVSVGIDALRDGNRVSYTRPGKHYFGEAENHTFSHRVRRVQEAFDRAGIVYETPADMMRILWWKFMINVGMNQASAVMRAPYGVFQTSADAQGLMERLMREVIALAEAAGVNLTGQDIEDWYAVLHTLSPQGKTSLLQDVEAGRKTEVEIFGGKVVELGETYGVPTPVNQTVLQIIKVLEREAAP
ncbi:MAG: ketopantoate reductase family protein [Caldilineales bacterium]|nr:ketopantoate reductase family protein [Caldilineales bacterium]